MFENTLGTVLCQTDLATIDALVAQCGLRAQATNETHYFSIVSGGRSALQDAAVENELLVLAYNTLNAAREKGHLPPFSLLSMNFPHATSAQ